LIRKRQDKEVFLHGPGIMSFAFSYSLQVAWECGDEGSRRAKRSFGKTVNQEASNSNLLSIWSRMRYYFLSQKISKGLTNKDFETPRRRKIIN
jgi:hypothetical protein